MKSPLNLSNLILLATTSIILTSAGDTFTCKNLGGNCTCFQISNPSTPGSKFEITCPLQNTHTVEIKYFPNQKFEITCNNYEEISEVYNPVTEPISSLQLPEELKGLPIDRYVINDCILSNATLKLLGAHGVKILEIFGNGSFAGATLTKEFFASVAASLEKLSVANVGLESISSDIFDGMRNLKTLNLYENMLQVIDGEFRSLRGLKRLDLSRNQIRRITEDAFAGLDQLERLHLFNNEIADLPPNAFSNLLNLQSLELSGNGLFELPEHLLDNLVNLKTFSVNVNKLESVPREIFKKNKDLISVRMTSNKNLRTLPPSLLSNLPKLEGAQLDYCALVDLPEDLFANSTQLQFIYLNKNNLTEIPEELFAGLKNLQELKLSWNKLTSLNNAPFKSLSKLRKLELSYNFLRRVDADALKGLSAVTELYLGNNILENVSLGLLRQLERVDLSTNRLKLERSDLINPFNGLENLREINLRQNLISSVFTDFSLVNLMRLDLSSNRIENLSYLDFQSSSAHNINLNVRKNRISKIDFGRIETLAKSPGNLLNITVQLDDNPFVCDCQAYDLLRYFKRDMGIEVETRVVLQADNLVCESPSNLHWKRVKDLALDQVVCEVPECSKNCTCSWKSHLNTFIVDCSRRGLEDAPVLWIPDDIRSILNRTEVYLQGNLLRNCLDVSSGYENVTVLNLSDNSIGDVKWIPINAEVINLDNNNITHLNSDVLSNLNMMTTLHNNPWRCDCAARNLSNFINRNKIIYKENITCQGSHRLVSSMMEKELCQTLEVLFITIGIIVAVGVAIPSLVFALYYRYNDEIKIWLYAHNLCLWFVTEDDFDKDKIYDAFISYSHVDEDFVRDELLSKLENGPNPYKICIHIRNFVPGEFIATQVIDSVKNSRRTIVVVSPDFLESVWGKMEFRLAHSQAMADGVTRVIVILLGDVDADPNMDEELRAYLNTNTYIKWGDPWFWERLRYALPHQKVSEMANNQKFQNISIKIDKMDLINGNGVPNCTSTPPAHPLLLKSHPLEFKTSEIVRNTPPAESGA